LNNELIDETEVIVGKYDKDGKTDCEDEEIVITALHV
jgi:hypothetical protein